MALIYHLGCATQGLPRRERLELEPQLDGTAVVASQCALISMLWAITSFFNPAGFQRRVANYHTFRRHLSVPLITVEWSHNGCFVLKPGDAEILLQVDGGDVLWQKERLLNIALKSVPNDAKAVAWVDCDVIFEHKDWSCDAIKALERVALVHLYHERVEVPPGITWDEPRIKDSPPTCRSAIHLMATGEAVREDFCEPGAPVQRGSTLGLAWACRREILSEHGLYDACILGSGDRAITCGAIGEFGWAATALRMNARRYEHYLQWARPFFESVSGKVEYIEGRVFHLWHGDLRLRRYAERHSYLETFDPFTDIALDGSGCWRWSSDKPDMHRLVREYFRSRSEDGD